MTIETFLLPVARVLHSVEDRTLIVDAGHLPGETALPGVDGNDGPKTSLI